MTDAQGHKRGADCVRCRDGPVLRMEAVSKRFQGVDALKDVDLELHAGEVHALVGENGAGKSTLMRILAGVYAEFEGRLWIDGEERRFASVRDAERAGVAIIHQELNLVPELSAIDNLFLGREPIILGAFIDHQACTVRARKIFAGLGVAFDLDVPVKTLRVGEQQLVEIAKALSAEARILIMDEPTSALTHGEGERLFDIIRRLSAEGVAVVYISHRMAEVIALSDRVTVLRDGKKVAAHVRGEFSQATLISAMVGRDLLSIARPPRPAPGPALISLRELNLTRAERGAVRQVLRDVSFDVRAGEIVGIGGLLGSGRSEILDVLFGVAAGQKSGKILLRGQPIAPASPREAMDLGFAYVNEDRKAKGLHLRNSIGENITLSLTSRLSRFGFRHFPAETAITADTIARVGVNRRKADQKIETLSGGNQQKIAIGKWLATKPDILLLDEPTRGVDVAAKSEIYKLIFDLAESGLGIIVVSSELPELILLADRIVVLAEGRQSGVLDHHEASEENILRLAMPSQTHVQGVAA